MLSEIDVAGIFLPPFFVYACFTLPLFLAIRWLLVRCRILRWVWHPALFEFALSLCLVSILIVYV